MVPINMRKIIQIGPVKKIEKMIHSNNPLIEEKLPTCRMTRWYEINGDDYFLKSSHNINSMINLINEFVGQELAELRKLKTANYYFFELTNVCSGLFYDDYFKVGNKYYILVTKSFLEKDKTYIFANDLFKNIIVKEYYDENHMLHRIYDKDTYLNYLLSLKDKCFSFLNYRKLINALLELTILDFFMGQWERNYSCNFMFEQKKSIFPNLSLAHVYDYSCSYLTYDKPLTMDEYKNCLGTLKFPSPELFDINDKFPVLSSIIKGYVDLDAKRFLDLVQRNNNFLLNPNIVTKFNDFFEQKQEILVKCLK